MIKRTLYLALRAHMEKPEITLIVGPRQAGKTTLLRQLQNDMVLLGKKCVFLSLDNESDKNFFLSQEALVTKLALEFGSGAGYVFIDEIQRKSDAGLFLKGIYDRNLPYKFVVTGSGSLELKEKIHESLVGRKQLFELMTLSLSEFINYKTHNRYSEKLTEFFEVDTVQSQKLFEEYILFGGYPKVVLAQTMEEKRAVIQDIYQSYLEKDIAYLLHIQKTESLTHLVQILANQTGGLVNVSELASTLGISAKTVQQYLWYLEKTYIIERISPFFRNIRKEITKAPMFYFLDIGLKQYVQNTFGVNTDRSGVGHVFENLIFLLLKERIEKPAHIHFWRTQDKAEVDFILDTGQAVIPVEVKYKELKKPEITRSFRSFLLKYHPQQSFIVHVGHAFEKTMEHSLVSFLPYYRYVRIG